MHEKHIITDLQDFNYLNIDYKWKVHSFMITKLDVVSRKTFYPNLPAIFKFESGKSLDEGE